MAEALFECSLFSLVTSDEDLELLLTRLDTICGPCSRYNAEDYLYVLASESNEVIGQKDNVIVRLRRMMSEDALTKGEVSYRAMLYGKAEPLREQKVNVRTLTEFPVEPGECMNSILEDMGFVLKSKISATVTTFVYGDLYAVDLFQFHDNDDSNSRFNETTLIYLRSKLVLKEEISNMGESLTKFCKYFTGVAKFTAVDHHWLSQNL